MRRLRHYVRLVAVAVFAGVIGLGCKTLNTETGVREYDPAKTEAVVQAIAVPASSAIRRALNRSPQHATEIANYIRTAGMVFQEMTVTKKFDPIELVKALDAIIIVKNDTILDLKNVAVALYSIFYAQRLQAELAPDAWMLHVANTFATAIDRGLKDAGMLGL